MAALQGTLTQNSLAQGAYASPTGRVYSGAYNTSPMKNYAMSALGTRSGHNNNRHLTQHELENNINGLQITEQKLRELFDQYDKDGSGFLERSEVKALYMEYDNFGIEYTDSEIDAIIAKHERGVPDGKISFDEFASLMLSVVQR